MGAIITMENHCVGGGLHSLVADALVARGVGTALAPSDRSDGLTYTGHVNALLWSFRMSSGDVV